MFIISSSSTFEERIKIEQSKFFNYTTRLKLGPESLRIVDFLGFKDMAESEMVRLYFFYEIGSDYRISGWYILVILDQSKTKIKLSSNS